MRPAIGRWAAAVAGVVALVALGVGVGFSVQSQPAIALVAAGGVLLLGVTAAEPAVVSLAALPLLLVVYRVDVGFTDLSVSDAALFVAALLALVFAPRPFSPALRNLLWLDFAYQFATLFTVLLNPFAANVVEWFHAWSLVSGALLVGWSVGSRGRARRGMSLLLAAAVFLAVITIVQGAAQWLAGDFSPVYVSWPYGMHKNMVGTVLGFAAVVVFARPVWLGWSRRAAIIALALFVVGIGLTQSRQAIVALGVGVVFIAFRQGMRGRGLTALMVLPALAAVATLVRDQFASDNRFNSAFQRLAWFADTMQAWAASPVVGYGLRFWYRADAPLKFQPPNAELEVLASAGIVGLIAFVVLMIGSLRVLLSLPVQYGTVAVAAVGTRLVQAQFDLFWVAAQVSIPFAIAGIAIGALARAEEDASPWHVGDPLGQAGREPAVQKEGSQ